MRRSDDPSAPGPPSRASDRIAQDGDVWFVRTREGLRGPFLSRTAAVHEAALYMETMSFLALHRDAFPQDVDREDVEIVNLRWPPWHSERD